MSDLVRAETLPARCHRDADIWTAERRSVFARPNPCKALDEIGRQTLIGPSRCPQGSGTPILSAGGTETSMRALVLVVALILAVSGLWLLRGSETSPPRDLDQLPEADAGGGGLAVGDVEQPANERSAIAAPPPEPGGEGELAYNLRVVRGESSEPVPGAIVSWMPPGFDQAVIPESELEVMRRDPAEMARRFGEAATADSEGRVTVRGPARGLGILGRDGDWYGLTSVRAFDYRTGEVLEPEPEYLLELRLDQTLVVRAVDTNGEPVPGVTVRVTRTAIVNGERNEMSYASGGSSTGSVDPLLGRHNQYLTREDNGDFALDARGGGVVSLRLDLRRTTETGLRRVSVDMQPSTLDLDAITTDRVIELVPDPESLQKALEALGK